MRVGVRRKGGELGGGAPTGGGGTDGGGGDGGGVREARRVGVGAGEGSCLVTVGGMGICVAMGVSAGGASRVATGVASPPGMGAPLELASQPERAKLATKTTTTATRLHVVPEGRALLRPHVKIV